MSFIQGGDNLPEAVTLTKACKIWQLITATETETRTAAGDRGYERATDSEHSYTSEDT